MSEKTGKASAEEKVRRESTAPIRHIETLLEACRVGDELAVRRTLEAGVPADPVAEGVDSPLCLASMFNHPGVVSLLLEAGARANHRGAYERTPLHHVSDPIAASCLLAHGADPNLRSNDHQDTLMALITRADDAAVASRLLEGGLNLSVCPCRMCKGRTHLMWAARCCRPNIVERLIEWGTDVNAVASDGASAFTRVLQAKDSPERARILRALVAGGVDAAARSTPEGETLLMAVCRKGDLESVSALLARGADPRAVVSHSGTTALSCAAEGGNPAVVALLKARGARPLFALPSPTDSLLELERRARAAPTEAEPRLAYARGLLQGGFRAAAYVELEAVRRLGGAVPEELTQALTLENPEGAVWHFSSSLESAVQVAPPVPDSHFPGARLRLASRELPLPILMGSYCERCDEKGETLCSICRGDGFARLYDPFTLSPCNPRQQCSTCAGTHYVVNTFRAGRGACPHLQLLVELEGPGFTFFRCPHCGLSALSCDSFKRSFACAECGLFDCACRKLAHG